MFIAPDADQGEKDGDFVYQIYAVSIITGWSITDVERITRDLYQFILHTAVYAYIHSQILQEGTNSVRINQETMI